VSSNLRRNELSPRLVARIAGIAALGGILAGAFDIGYVQSALVVAGNAAATVHNILAHEQLYRMGFSAHVLEMLLNIIGEITFFILIRRVNPVVAAIALCCGLIGTAVESADLLNAYMPLVLSSHTGSIDPAQIPAASYMFLQLREAGLTLSFVFYGLDELLSGVLIFRSGFLPRIIGILLGISGACYLSHSFLTFVAPRVDARAYPYILFACLPGEASIALWMTIVGLNVTKWEASASERPADMLFT